MPGSVKGRREAPLAVYCVGVYTVSAVATVAFNAVLWGAMPPSVPVLTALAGALVVALALALRTDRFGELWPVMAALYLVVAVMAIAASARQALPLRPYGDGNSLNDLVRGAIPYPRWLIPVSIAGWFYKGIWAAAPVASRLPPSLRDVTFVTSVLGILSMSAGAWWILERYRDRAITLMPLLVPVCLLFVTGYTEVYPWVTPLFIGLLGWLATTPVKQRSPVAVGLACGLLPVVYIGFAPLALILGLSFFLVCPRRVPEALAVAVGAFVLGVAACQPGGVVVFFSSLYGEMNFGNAHTMFARYGGRAAGSTAIWFENEYVWRGEHVTDLAYMYTWAGGIAFPLLLIGSSIVWLRHRVWDRTLDARAYELGATLLLYWSYFLLMIPKMGPRADIDLFFTTYVVTAFVAGALLDDLQLGHRRKTIVICVVLGASVAAASYLCFGVIPDRL